VGLFGQCALERQTRGVKTKKKLASLEQATLVPLDRSSFSQKIMIITQKKRKEKEKRNDLFSQEMHLKTPLLPPGFEIVRF
jgi:hypothetical protein